jgi:hypothetical protein
LGFNLKNKNQPDSPEKAPTRWCAYGEGLACGDESLELDEFGIASVNSVAKLNYHLNRALDAALVIDHLRVVGEYIDHSERETPFQAIEAAVARARAESDEEQG